MKFSVTLAIGIARVLKGFNKPGTLRLRRLQTDLFCSDFCRISKTIVGLPLNSANFTASDRIEKINYWNPKILG